MDQTKILVVDDDEGICEMMSRFLLNEGYDARYVLDGYEAIKLSKKERFNLIFLDIIMPGISGIDTIEEIKKYLPEIKTIIMTGALIDGSLLAELKRKGVAGCLQKPFDIERVLEIIKENK